MLVVLNHAVKSFMSGLDNLTYTSPSPSSCFGSCLHAGDEWMDRHEAYCNMRVEAFTAYQRILSSPREAECFIKEKAQPLKEALKEAP
eukprot:1150457-Pelagomonas_calceolata.AAC.2